MANVTVIDKGWGTIKRELEKARSKEVVVGVLEGSVNDGVSIAEYATYNEFGSDDGKLPARPANAMAFDENRAAIDADFTREGKRMMQGRQSAVGALTVIGQKHADRIKNVITQRDILPKLADSTVAAKKGSTKTLVDTGAYAAAVQIEIR